MQEHRLPSFLCVAVIAISSMFSCTSFGGGVTMLVGAVKRSSLLGEPVVLRVTFTNSESRIEHIPADLSIERGRLAYYISTANSTFERIRPPAELDPSGRTIEIQPGEAFAHEEVLFLNARKKEPLFAGVGLYHVRVDRAGVTNTVEIDVIEPTNRADIKASEIMRSPAVLEMIGGIAATENARRELEKCLQGESVFSPYAAFFLASAEPNKANALALLDRADVPGFPLHSQAVLEKARVNLALGNPQQAYELFERVLREFPNSGAASKIKSQHLLEEARKEKVRAMPDVYEQTIKQLESEWYDVKGFWRDIHGPRAQEYEQKRIQIFDQLFAGKISDAERARQEAELLKTYIKKYRQPLPPEEWKRRYDAYAKEEAEIEQQRRLKQMQHLEEAERLLRSNRARTNR